MIISKIVKIQKTDYPEKILNEMFDNIIRWAVVGIDNDCLKISITILEKDK